MGGGFLPHSPFSPHVTSFFILHCVLCAMMGFPDVVVDEGIRMQSGEIYNLRKKRVKNFVDKGNGYKSNCQLLTFCCNIR